ncbi:hypothetical protein QE152_g37369 [Popillia japonica]|uniref:Uncharacterized protein n=1 Tax=Popillia japonica TaxID=7064 RepID=A0AAW1IA13_POPJA
MTCKDSCLSKWASNDSEILIDSIATENNIIPLDKDQTIKTLGLSWNSTSDTFQFSIHIENSSQVTKRYILSTISKLFDPKPSYYATACRCYRNTISRKKQILAHIRKEFNEKDHS